jgi:hypothetical protein
MPTNPRDSSATIEIGRGEYYGPTYSEHKPVRRSSTLRSDDMDYYGRSIPDRHVRYEDYRPPYDEDEVYDPPGRPSRYEDRVYYDRWRDTPGPVVRSGPRTPSPETQLRYGMLRL